MEKYEVNQLLSDFGQKLIDLEKALDINNLKLKIEKLEELTKKPNFWDDHYKASQISKKISLLSDDLNSFNNLSKKYKEILDWLDISKENSEEWDILEEDIKIFKTDIENFSIKILLNGEYDDCNAIIEIHPGAGGTEAQDWCDMVYNMYQKYALKHNYKIEVLDYLPGDEAGVKSVTILVSGNFAYGYLKSEIGVHRLVRISPFDANKRRHTSFVSVMVTPEINNSDSVTLNDDELKIDVYRSGGAGGQSVNTTDSAVRITHIPTGIVVTCQNERSQIKNKELAKKLLISKLIQKNKQEEMEKLSKLQGKKMSIGWGSQIRSYVFQPYQLIKDHRTDYETSQIDDVLNGELDDFINQYLKWSYEA